MQLPAADDPKPRSRVFLAAQGNRVHVLSGVDEPVSATELRARLKAGQDCGEWLTPEVAGYILEAKLYGDF